MSGFDSKNTRPQGKKHIVQGVFYLALSAVVLFALLYLIPNVMNIDVSEIMSSKAIVAVLRCALGAALLVLLVLSIIYAVRSFTLQGQDWRDGIANARQAHIFGRDAISILLLGLAGIALIVWGVADLIGL